MGFFPVPYIPHRLFVFRFHITLIAYACNDHLRGSRDEERRFISFYFVLFRFIRYQHLILLMGLSDFIFVHFIFCFVVLYTRPYALPRRIQPLYDTFQSTATIP